MALQTNLVAVIYATPLAALALQWFTKLKYITHVPLIHSFGALMLSKRAFERISINHRDTIKEIFDRYNAEFNEQSRKANQEAMEVMIKQGIRLVELSPDEIKRFQRICQETVKEMEGKIISREVYNEILKHLEAFRKSAR